MKRRNREDSRPAGRRTPSLTKKTVLAASGSVLALGSLGAGIAFATGSIPGPGGTINACYRDVHGEGHGSADHAGALRVIPSGTSCGKNETSLSWSQTGPQGPQGQQGPQGPQGPSGPANTAVLKTGAFPVTNGTANGGYVTCLPGEVVTGGGVDINNGSGVFGAYITASNPVGNTTWSGTVTNLSGSTVTVQVWAICAS